MPNGGRTGRAIAKSQGAFVTPIVTNNPVFQVKLADVDDKLEQPAGQQKEMKDEIRRGEAVVGTAMGKDNKKKHKGIVQNIVKDANGNVTSFTITDEDGDQIKLDPTSVARLDLHDEGKNKTAGDTFKVMESRRAKSFEDFINEEMTSDEYAMKPKDWRDLAYEEREMPKAFKEFEAAYNEYLKGVDWAEGDEVEIYPIQKGYYRISQDQGRDVIVHKTVKDMINKDRRFKGKISYVTNVKSGYLKTMSVILKEG